MNTFLKKASLGVALGAATIAMTAAPAQAQRDHRSYGHYGHGYHRGGDATGAAILGGIVGLGVGAAIASSNNRDRYYDDGYYAPPPPPPGYYGEQGYYDNGYAYQPRCYTQSRWDPYYRRHVRVRVCN